jgi:hypothetical protein
MHLALSFSENKDAVDIVSWLPSPNKRAMNNLRVKLGIFGMNRPSRLRPGNHQGRFMDLREMRYWDTVGKCRLRELTRSDALP